MTTFGKEILARAEKLSPEVIEVRRQFHRYPELSWQEHKTAKLLVERLAGLGLSVRNDICETAVVAELRGAAPGPLLGLRADMDALPMDDGKDVPYASRVKGAMHACGHDAHMAMALGVAEVLQPMSGCIRGGVRFIFQPCEEASPSGAHELVKRGVMDGVERVFAFHVDPEIPAGKIGLRHGALTANCTEFRVAVFGKGGHGARPHQSIDTVYIMHQIMEMAYGLPSRRTEPFVPAVLSIGHIHGGMKANVIPNRVDISGTMRTVDEITRTELIAKLRTGIDVIASANGAEYQLEFPQNVPAVFNDAYSVELARSSFSGLFRPENIVAIDKVSMGGEDFSWYLTKAPGVLIRLGSRKSGEEVHHLHTNHFDIDERALPIGVALMSDILLTLLG
jgi:amidohydrolase